MQPCKFSATSNGTCKAPDEVRSPKVGKCPEGKRKIDKHSRRDALSCIEDDVTPLGNSIVWALSITQLPSTLRSFTTRKPSPSNSRKTVLGTSELGASGNSKVSRSRQ